MRSGRENRSRTMSSPRSAPAPCKRKPYRHHDLGFVVDLGGATAAANPLNIPLSGCAGQGRDPRIPPVVVAGQPDPHRQRLGAEHRAAAASGATGPGAVGRRSAGQRRARRAGERSRPVDSVAAAAGQRHRAGRVPDRLDLQERPQPGRPRQPGEVLRRQGRTPA